MSLGWNFTDLDQNRVELDEFEKKTGQIQIAYKLTLSYSFFPKALTT